MTEKEKRKTYSGKFKVEVIEAMRKGNLSYREAARRFGIRNATQVERWERIYLEEGKEALLVERRGRACGAQLARKLKIDKKEEDLIAENQR